MSDKPKATNTGGQASEEYARVIREVERGGRIAVASGVIGQIIRLALQILLGRVLGSHAYGLYTLARSVLEILTRVSLIGLHNGAVHFLAIFNGEGDPVRVRGTILASIGLVCGTSSLVGLGLWLAADWASRFLFQEPDLAFVLKGFAVVIPFYALLFLLASCARGLRHIAYYSGMTHVLHPLGVFCAIAGGFALGMRLDGVLWGFGLATALACGLMFIGLWHIFPSLFALRQGYHFAARRILPYAIKVFFNDLSQQILMHMDRLMLGSFATARDVGIYGMAAFMGGKIDFFQRMFNSIFAPVIADLYNQGKQTELIRLFQTVSKWTFSLTLPMFFAVVFLGHLILDLFGRDFQAGWSTLFVLALANLINVGVGPVGYMLVMTGRPGLEWMNNCLAGVGNILLNLWLIPQYGALGAALATGIAIAGLNLIRLIQVRRIHHCYPFRLGTLKVILAGALAGGAGWQLAQWLPSPLWGQLLSLIVFLALYLGLLTVFGFDEDDRLILRHVRRKFGGTR